MKSPAKAKRKARKVKAWAIVGHGGTILAQSGNAQELHINLASKRAAMVKHFYWGKYPGVSVVPCEITWRMP